MGDTIIRWTDRVWNPIRGCSIVTPGCTNCYAMRVAGTRHAGPGRPYEGLTRIVNGHPIWTGEVRSVESKLREPFAWERQAVRTGSKIRVFVNSMGDLHHENVDPIFLAQVYEVMEQCPHVTFQVLTKRPHLMRPFLVKRWCHAHRRAEQPRIPTNIWVGTSVEDQRRADERVPYLVQTPGAVRFLSCEPLLGPISLQPWLWELAGPAWAGNNPSPCIGWIIVGGESGPRRRPMNLDWARSLRDQATEAYCPFYFKQTGGPRTETGQLLDGRRWEQFPDQPYDLEEDR